MHRPTPDSSHADSWSQHTPTLDLNTGPSKDPAHKRAERTPLFSRLFGRPVRLPGPLDCQSCRNCLAQFTNEQGMPLTLSFMVVCPSCGDKRCAKAQDHRARCPKTPLAPDTDTDE